ncbi:MAG: alpha/beta fold hydrolase [Polaromonas sp.]|nr:alpha/beta fold hydrolase [Polaromonas sp.]
MENNHQKNSRWHTARVTDTVIVFVHGLLSSSEDCWKNQNGTYWPELVSQDLTFEDSSIFLAGYYSDVDSGQYDFAQCAREVSDALKHVSENGRAPIDYSRIVFVAHSLGGVIVRRLLEENTQEFAGKQVGIALMASPSGGSTYANFFATLARIYGHQAALDLRPQAQALADVDYRFRGLLEKKLINITGIEACEHHGPLRWKWLPLSWKWLPFRLPPIVRVESSSKYFGTPKIIKGTDHSSIVKPDGLQHAAHEFLKNFFRSQWARNESAGDRPKSELAKVSSTEVLFNVYRSQGRPYCIVREIDVAFRNRIPLKSVWVHGASGVGKTTIVKRYLDQAGLKPLELTLGHISKFSAESFNRELAETINSRQGVNIMASHANVVMALAQHFGRQGVVLFLDEVPVGAIPDDSERQLLVSISTLIDAIQKVGGGQLQIVVCSIGRPQLNMAGQKCSEQIELISAEPWKYKELKELVATIKQALPDVNSDSAIEAEMIKAASGSPRVVKEFYRRRVMVSSGNESSIQSLRTVLYTLGLNSGEKI